MKNSKDKYQYESFFDVPDNYFEELPQKVMSRVAVSKGYYSAKKIAFLIALPCLTIFLSWYYFFGIDNDKKHLKLDWEQISNVEIIEYMEFENVSASDILKNIRSEEELENLLLDFSIEEEFALQQENFNTTEWIELSDYDFTPL